MSTLIGILVYLGIFVGVTATLALLAVAVALLIWVVAYSKEEDS
jgi:hypothetical protein